MSSEMSSVKHLQEEKEEKEGKKKRFCSPRSLIWTAILLSGTIGLLVHLAIQTLYFMEDQKYVDVVVSDTKFQFPDLTFCKVQNFNARKYMNTSLQLANGPFIPYSSINDRLVAFWQLIQTEVNADLARLAARSLRKNAFTLDLYEPAIAEFVGCAFSQQPCSFTEFVVDKHPQYLLCHTYTSPDYDFTDYTYGLQLYLANWEKQQSSLTNSYENEIQDYKISIHRRGTKPNLLNQSIFTRREFMHMVALSHTVIARLSKPDAPCIEERGNVTYIVDFTTNETRTFLATQHDCELIRRQEFFVDRCQCLDSEDYVPVHLGGYKLCHEVAAKYYLFPYNASSPKTLLNPTLDTVFEATKDGVIARYNCFKNASFYLQQNKEILAGCLPDCETHAYTFAHQSQRVIRLALLNDRLISEREAEYPNNFSRLDYGDPFPIYVKFYVAKPKATLMREVWAYPAKSYLSDIGGILGLWIGVSFITLFDIGDRMVKDMLKPSVKIIKSKTVRKKPPSHSTGSNSDKSGFDKDPESIFSTQSVKSQTTLVT